MDNIITNLKDRGIIRTIEFQGKTYGQDKNGDVFQKACGTERVKGTIDDYQWIIRWVKVHYASYKRMSVIQAFNKIA